MDRFFRTTARTDHLEAYAQHYGWTFHPRDVFGMRRYFQDMHLFRRGIRKQARHILQKQENALEHYGVFDYYYTISSGNSSRRFSQTVFYSIHAGLMLPEFHLFPERWYHRVGKWFGMQDIEFVAYPEFSGNYVLQGSQQDFIVRLFQDDRLITFFNEHTGWSVEAVGRYFVMYKSNVLQRVQDLTRFIEIGNDLNHLLAERSTALEKILGDDEE